MEHEPRHFHEQSLDALPYYLRFPAKCPTLQAGLQRHRSPMPRRALGRHRAPRVPRAPPRGARPRRQPGAATRARRLRAPARRRS